MDKRQPKTCQWHTFITNEPVCPNRVDVEMKVNGTKYLICLDHMERTLTGIAGSHYEG